MKIKMKIKSTKGKLAVFIVCLLLLPGIVRLVQYIGANSTIERDGLPWAMAPYTKYYLITDGAEPADNYWELEYHGIAEVYYTYYPGKKPTFVTPECKPISLDMEEYAYLEDLPISVRGSGDDYYYIYADGNRAFGGKTFQWAGDFQGDYAEVSDENWIPALINKKGEIVCQGKDMETYFTPLDGNLYTERKDEKAGVRIFDVETGETVKVLPYCDDIEKTSKGYIMRTFKNEPNTCQLVDENFNPLWDGKAFLKLEEVKGGENPLYRTGDDDHDVYFRHSGEVILDLPKKSFSVYSESNDTILAYEKNMLTCYDGTGKRIFFKKTEANHEDFDSLFIQEFTQGMAVITLDGKKCGIIDEEGNELTDFVYDYALIAKDGSILVSYKQKAGVLWGKNKLEQK